VRISARLPLRTETRTIPEDPILGPGALSENGTANQLAEIAVDKIHRGGRIADAIALLGQESSGNSRLSLGLNYILGGMRLNSDAAFQKFTNDYEPFLNSTIIDEVLPKVRRAVCAVALDKVREPGIKGSGFLIGPDLVMTNYHVIEEVLRMNPVSGDVEPNGEGRNIYFFFDYFTEPVPNIPADFPARHKSVMVRAADDWLGRVHAIKTIEW
jgi:hypothetical protein